MSETPHSAHIHIDEERPLLGGLGRTLTVGSIGAGVLFLIGGAVLGLGGGWRAFWSAYLTGFVYCLTLSLGALIFIIIQHVTRASWSIVVRRIAEFYANNMILLLVLAIPLITIGAPHLYPWINPDPSRHDFHLIEHKAVYLNQPFFIARIVLYFGIWITLARYFLTRSLRQDSTGEPSTTVRMWTTAGPAVLIFALTSTFAAFDLLMSLTPSWYSTMFGVYFFAGSLLSILALLGLTALFLQGRGHLVNIINNEHYHDIGKLLFAFVFFWGYIAFSQFMLIWYANIPEETQWFLDRQQGNWLWLEVGLLFFHFFLPFLGLIGRWAKRRRPVLAFWCVWMLIWHWIDIVYLALPTFLPQGVSAMNLAAPLLMTLGMLGLWLGFAALSAQGKPIIPVRDPRLIESLEFDNIKV
ncbi:MAG: quinol:cytochrome C oxidoreductase [bacterium]|nr:quinol:cytochrome C oxidoreductase [bacterium]